MRKETCWNCSTRMTEPVAFCPTCGQPTRHATDADRMEYDLKQWRSHVDRAANGGKGRQVTPAAPRAGVATTVREKPFVTPPPQPKRRRKMPALRVPKLRMPRRPARVEHREIHLDADDPFAYTACVSCGATDWILRGSQNDDGTFKYWCLRCSRAFKTTVRIAHGRKPFIAAATVVAVLVFFLYLLR
jgi:hypothetical protein